MKWCRFQVGQHVSYGIVGNETITEVAGTPFGEHTVTSTSHSLGQVKLLPPVIPPMLYAAGPNYRGLGKKARNVSRESALDYVFGYSIGNDISQREWQRGDRTMFRGKNCDTFKPFGPWIVPDLDPMNFRIVVRHNGTVWENFFSADQIWDTATWIEELSRYTTLHPGVLRNYVAAETS